MHPYHQVRRQVLQHHAVIRLISFLSTRPEAFDEFLGQVGLRDLELDPRHVLLELHHLHGHFWLQTLLPFLNELMIVLDGCREEEEWHPRVEEQGGSLLAGTADEKLDHLYFY